MPSETLSRMWVISSFTVSLLYLLGIDWKYRLPRTTDKGNSTLLKVNMNFAAFRQPFRNQSIRMNLKSQLQVVVCRREQSVSDRTYNIKIKKQFKRITISYAFEEKR